MGDETPWIMATFDKEQLVQAIQTRGGGRYVTSFKLRYRVYDEWHWYSEEETSDAPTVFAANSNDKKVKTVLLRKPFYATDVRIMPVGWTGGNGPCMQFDLLG